MKKSVNILGIVLLLILFTGMVFKRLHFPGASVMVTISIFLFLTAYLPVFLISLSRQMKNEGTPVNKLLLYIGAPGVTILTFGILAKIMHWPGAAWGLWGGIGLISLILLLFLIINRKENEKLSMISVLIVTILLGSFSFNMFRYANIRTIEDAYEINGSAFSESSVIIWKECESMVQKNIITDTIIFSEPLRKELIQLHALVQETDLIIGGMIENISIVENNVLSDQTADAMYESLSGILMTDGGLEDMDLKFTEYKNLINSMSLLNSVDKAALTNNLVYPFENQESGLVFNYLGVYNLVPEVCLNTLLLWKSKIWETEYQLLEIVMKQGAVNKEK
jgi:hypothetical protein